MSPLLFVGLGNPESEYEDNRHNVGFMAVDEIVRRHQFDFSGYKKKLDGLLSDGRLAGEKVMVFKPLTYMNRSGQAVQLVAAFFKIQLRDVVVFHDDMDIELGKVKVKVGGGSAGHNGIRSIDMFIPGDYVKIRIGIGRPQPKGTVVDYVLGNFTAEEKVIKDKVLEILSRNIDILVKDGVEKFATKLGEELKNGV